MNFINPDLEFFEENRDCSYFEDQKSDMRYRFLNSCSIEEYQKKLERGWRRFGKIHFAPECKSCTKCVSMRIDVKNFQFSKSQKRVLNKNKDTKVFIRPPTVTKEHMDLYHKYHTIMQDKKDWKYVHIDHEDYIKSYVETKEEYAKEFLYGNSYENFAFTVSANFILNAPQWEYILEHWEQKESILTYETK